MDKKGIKWRSCFLFMIILFLFLGFPICADGTENTGKAKIYIIHSSFSFIPINIIIDQEIYAKLDGKHYTVLERDAGDLLVISSLGVLGVNSVPNGAILLKVQSGKIYYLKTYGNAGGVIIKQVDEETGRKDIESGKYSKVSSQK